MKASSAVTELRQYGVFYALSGAVTIAVASSNDHPWHGEDQQRVMVVIAALAAICLAMHLVWTLRGLRRAPPAPDFAVTVTWWWTFCRRVVPAAAPTAALGVYLALLSGLWFVGAFNLVFGAALVFEAMVAWRVERSHGARVLRFQSRYFLAH
ncbi:MAG TPA: hypothetical protein VI300_16440 [Solirubrobacter sp.]